MALTENAVKKALEEQGTYREHDAHLVRQFVQVSKDVEALEKAIGKDFTVQGSRGQTVANPLIKSKQEALKIFISLARELHFTPATRGDEKKPPTGDKFGL